jgi:hypothetical protein
MRLMMSGQLCESKKVCLRQHPVAVAPPRRVRRSGARAEGTLWQRRMRSLAVRLPKGRARRDRSGSPMKRG